MVLWFYKIYSCWSFYHWKLCSFHSFLCKVNNNDNNNNDNNNNNNNDDDNNNNNLKDFFIKIYIFCEWFMFLKTDLIKINKTHMIPF